MTTSTTGPASSAVLGVKTILITVGILAVLALIGLYAMHKSAPQGTSAMDESSLPTSSTDTSDTALTKDTAAIDTNLSGVDQDSANVDQSFTAAQDAGN